MLKLVENILKKHLDDAAREYERDVEMSVVTSFELMWQWPSFEERRALARELIEVIRGVDLSTLRRIPTQEETEKFVKTILPWDVANDEDFVTYHAGELIRWLEYRPKHQYEFQGEL